MKIRLRQLIISIVVLIALGVTAWATWAYQSSQNEIEALQNEVERLNQKKNEPVVMTAESAGNPGTSETATPKARARIVVSQGPQLTVEPNLLDLGTIRKADGPRTGTFSLKNTGGTPLTIKYVLSSCGCTTAEIKNVTVAPGSAHELPVTYDPNYFGQTLELGPVEKWIAIMSDDPQSPLAKVYLKANVIP